MKRFACTIVMCVSTLISCSGDSEDADTTATLSTAPTRTSGYVVTTDGQYSWLSLNRADSLAMTDQTGGQLDEIVQSFSLSQGQQVYMEAITSRLPDGIVLTEVLRAMPADMAASIRSVDTLVFLASGNEPFWAIELTADSLIYRSPEQEHRLALTDKGSVADSLWLFQAAGPDDTSSIMMQIVRDPCYDSMSGVYSAFAATVLLWQRQLTGCAVQGLVEIPAEPEPGVVE